MNQTTSDPPRTLLKGPQSLPPLAYWTKPGSGQPTPQSSIRPGRIWGGFVPRQRSLLWLESTRSLHHRGILSDTALIAAAIGASTAHSTWPSSCEWLMILQLRPTRTDEQLRARRRVRSIGASSATSPATCIDRSMHCIRVPKIVIDGYRRFGSSITGQISYTRTSDQTLFRAYE